MKDFQPAARLRNIQKSPIRQFFDRAPAGSVNLGLGEPDIPTPEVVRSAAVRVILEEQNGYTTHAGLLSLRERISEDNAHLDLTPDGVIITAGSQEALYLALMVLVDDGDEVLIPDPGFVAYSTITRMAGGQPVFYRCPAATGFEFDAEEFRRKLTVKTKAVICISPSNPTGRSMSREQLIDMADALKDSGAYAISDEIYRELYYTPERPPSLCEFYPRTIVIGGLSKSMSMTGWRIGWLCGEEAVARSALILHGYVTTCASTISQKAALAAWTPEAGQARQKQRQIFRDRRDALLASLSNETGLHAVTPEGAFYTMVDVSDYGHSLDVAETLLSHGVITVPGSAFGAEGEGFLRVSFCADIPVLTEGVRRMRSAFASLPCTGQ